MSVPSHIVAIGASAGGLEALSEFFDHLPATDRLAFVVIQHLSPDHRSYMVDLLQKHTTLMVREAVDGAAVEAGCVYHIPPGQVLSIGGGMLRLEPQRDRRGVNPPIDAFFRSLAADRGADAVAIVLSGTGSDGAAGVRAIKEAGGMALAQDPDSARFDGMPRAAAATGVVDIVARPGEMPDALLEALDHPRINVAPDEGAASPRAQAPLDAVVRLLHEHTGVDFSGYKATTLVRRLERRMGIRRCRSLDDYVALLRDQPAETDVLRKELLIGVTQFFRDSEAWDVLRHEVVPALFTANQGGREIRCWVAACSTGEEAYSLAMLLHEQREACGQHFRIKVFATDIDRQAIEHASQGIYPHAIASDLTRDRLERFFVRRPDGLQVNATLRESVIFAPHDLIRDPPFTRMDLTTCRNMLIYLQPEPQERVLALLNFSLKPNGWLFLGASESPAALGSQLQAVNGRWRLYQATGTRRQPAGVLPARLDQGPRWREPPMTRRSGGDPLLERVHQELVRDLDLRCLVVDGDGNLVHSFGDVGRFLRMAPGPVDTRIANLLAPGLAETVAGALRVAAREERDVAIEGVRTGEHAIDVRIKPLRPGRNDERLALVYLLGSRPLAPLIEPQRLDVEQASRARVDHLEERLQQTQANLQSTIEELETSNEELQATNEELVSANEELQSTNEELQSLNEELYTVNSELQLKVAEVSRANADMANLLAGANVATVFLEQSLNVRRFTPAAGELLNLLERDLGRPFAHIANPLAGGDLLELAARTALEGRDQRAEFAHPDGRSFLVTVRPYRTARGEDDGVVLTFVDISELRRSLAAHAASEARLRTVLDHLPDGVTVIFDAAGLVTAVAGRAAPAFGISLASVGRPVEALVPDAAGEGIAGACRAALAGRGRQALVRHGGRDLLVHSAPLPGDAQTAGMAVVIDVSALAGAFPRSAHERS